MQSVDKTRTLLIEIYALTLNGNGFQCGVHTSIPKTHRYVRQLNEAEIDEKRLKATQTDTELLKWWHAIKSEMCNVLTKEKNQ